MPFKTWKIAETEEFLRILNLQEEYLDWEEISKLLKEVNIKKTPKQCLKKYDYMYKDGLINLKFKSKKKIYSQKKKKINGFVKIRRKRVFKNTQLTKRVARLERNN